MIAYIFYGAVVLLIVFGFFMTKVFKSKAPPDCKNPRKPALKSKKNSF